MFHDWRIVSSLTLLGHCKDKAFGMRSYAATRSRKRKTFYLLAGHQSSQEILAAFSKLGWMSASDTGHPLLCCPNLPTRVGQFACHDCLQAMISKYSMFRRIAATSAFDPLPVG